MLHSRALKFFFFFFWGVGGVDGKKILIIFYWVMEVSYSVEPTLTPPLMPNNSIEHEQK